MMSGVLDVGPADALSLLLDTRAAGEWRVGLRGATQLAAEVGDVVVERSLPTPGLADPIEAFGGAMLLNALVLSPFSIGGSEVVAVKRRLWYTLDDGSRLALMFTPRDAPSRPPKAEEAVALDSAFVRSAAVTEAWLFSPGRHSQQSAVSAVLAFAPGASGGLWPDWFAECVALRMAKAAEILKGYAE
eukprot:Polyplicarium_translucidae@DN1117_c0_g1_i1.p3